MDNPADVNRWLLRSNSPVLPRVIEAVRPYVLPKLREENARAKAGKGGKKRGLKDVVVEGLYVLRHTYGCFQGLMGMIGDVSDDFEVAVFLTEISARHSILRKEKRAMGEKKARLGTTDGRLTGAGTGDAPVEVDQDGDVEPIREDSQERGVVNILDIPLAEDGFGVSEPNKQDSEQEEGLFVSDESGEEEDPQQKKPSKRRRGKRASTLIHAEADEDIKAKMSLKTTYDGFSIYGRILCLVVKRRGMAKGNESVGRTGQATMEEWITSTQLAEGQMIMDD